MISNNYMAKAHRLSTCNIDTTCNLVQCLSQCSILLTVLRIHRNKSFFFKQISLLVWVSVYRIWLFSLWINVSLNWKSNISDSIIFITNRFCSLFDSWKCFGLLFDHRQKPEMSESLFCRSYLQAMCSGAGFSFRYAQICTIVV